MRTETLTNRLYTLVVRVERGYAWPQPKKHSFGGLRRDNGRCFFYDLAIVGANDGRTLKGHASHARRAVGRRKKRGRMLTGATY